MNIQQLRYVIALSNSGTFREAAEKMYVSQPSLSVSIRDLEEELGFKIFSRTPTGTVLTKKGMEFYEQAQGLVKEFDLLENRYRNKEGERQEFSIASQHYDFLPPLISEFATLYPQQKDFRLFESTTVEILDEVAQGYSELGVIYLNQYNQAGIMQKAQKLGLEVVDLAPFQTHVYVREGHPLVGREVITHEDLNDLPAVRFTQKKEDYLYYSENFFDRETDEQIFNVTDRATLNGILERTDAYATGSGFLDSHSVNGITVLPIQDSLSNKMVYVKKADSELSKYGKAFAALLKDYLVERASK